MDIRSVQTYAVQDKEGVLYGAPLEYVFDWDTGKGKGLQLTKNQWVANEDILSWEAGVVQVAQVQQRKTTSKGLLQKRVYTNRYRTFLGHVANYDFDHINGNLLSIQIQRRWLWMKQGELHISQKDILEITKKGILVRPLERGSRIGVLDDMSEVTPFTLGKAATLSVDIDTK